MRIWAFSGLVRASCFGGITALALLAGCGGGGGGGGSTTTLPISVSISPGSASLNQNGTQTFTASVSNDSASAGVTWSFGTGAGALSAANSTSVTYTAPASIAAVATVTLTATSITDPTKTATATITLNPPVSSTITSVAASCTPVSIQIGATSQCSATVNGTGGYSSAVTWSVGGVAGGNSTVGTISASGVYSAPSAVPGTNPVTVTATSSQDTTKSGSALLTITAAASSVSVASFSPMSTMPGATITITGSGFDATQGPTVVFTEAGGLAFPVTPTSVTSTSMTVTAPPFIDSSSGAFEAGTFSLSVNQSSGSSNAVPGLQILALPAIPSAPGTLTVAFLQSTRNFILNTTETSVQSAPFDTPDLNTALASEASALRTILPGLSAVVSSPQSTYTIGTYAGQNVVVTSAALAQVDQMLLAMLAAQAGLPAVSGAQPALTSGGGCPSDAAAAIYNDVTTNANPNAQQDVDAYYASLSSSQACAAPQAISQGLTVTLGTAAVAMGVLAITLPADAALAALALPTAAVLSVATLAAGGQIAIGGQLASASSAGIQLIQNGVQEFEELLQTVVAKGSTLGVMEYLGVNNPDSWIGLAGAVFAGNSVLNAFINGPPNNGGGTSTAYTLSVTTSGTGTGTVGSYPGVVNCGTAGGSCSGNFANAAVVILTAIPDAGYVFTGWSGACTGTGDCTLVMNSSQSVDASFGPAPGTVYTGTYSAPFQGTATDPDGGVYSAEADFTFTLNLTTNPDGSITGSADSPVNVNISVVSCPSQDTCSPDSFAVTVTGPITGSNGTITGNLSSGGSSPLTVNITGTVSNGSIAITGTFTETFEGQSTDAPPTYTTLSGTISGLTLTQQP